jgi:transposase-like protein
MTMDQIKAAARAVYNRVATGDLTDLTEDVIASILGKVVEDAKPIIMGTCPLCGKKTITIVHIGLSKKFVCDDCCLEVTKQTVETLTVSHGTDKYGPTTEIRSIVGR